MQQRNAIFYRGAGVEAVLHNSDYLQYKLYWFTIYYIDYSIYLNCPLKTAIKYGNKIELHVSVFL